MLMPRRSKKQSREAQPRVLPLLASPTVSFNFCLSFSLLD